ncbi:hypothetical protein F5Y09DRAFT_350625 [Xylaria sp. FL1042]|nr:hypothetical protein F5Y09DRAFT_350625 [Xylaria sp. FL1042]
MAGDDDAHSNKGVEIDEVVDTHMCSNLTRREDSQSRLVRRDDTYMDESGVYPSPLLNKWRKYERELRSLTRNLNTERVKLQNVCEKFLVGIVPESQIDAMIKDPMGGLWREERIQARIQSRLWESYGLFEDTISDIKRAVDEMHKRIEK